MSAGCQRGDFSGTAVLREAVFPEQRRIAAQLREARIQPQRVLLMLLIDDNPGDAE